MAQRSIMEILDAVTSQDLDDVDGQIADLDRRLEAARALRKVIDVRLNGKPERAKPAPRTVKTSDHENKLKAAKYLVAAGPTKGSVVVEQCGIETSNTASFFDHEWFERHSQGVYKVSSEGRRVVSSLERQAS